MQQIDIENKTKLITTKYKLINYWASSVNILVFGVIGVLLGLYAPQSSGFLHNVGDLFIHLIKMLIVPIIFVSILVASGNLAQTESAGKVGSWATILFVATSAIAIFLGIVTALIFKPGQGLAQLPQALLNGQEVFSDGNAASLVGFWDFIFGIIPLNPIEALVKGNIIQILVFATFLGIAISYISNPNKEKVMRTLDVFNDALLWMMAKIILLAPIGVMGLMAYSVQAMGIQVLLLVLKLVILYTILSIIYTYGFFGLLIKLFTKIKYTTFIKTSLPLQIISFTTASSLVSVPTNLRCASQLKAKSSIAKFVIPLGATVNMNGNGMFYAMAAVFFAQMFNIDISLSGYIVLGLVSIIGAVATAGVPGPSVLLVAVVAAVNLPLTAIPLLFAVDRIFDMIRTAINVMGDLTVTMLIDAKLNKDNK